MSDSSLYTPEDFGLDRSQYPEIYPSQIEALELAAFTDKRFSAFAMPTGSGKSLLAWILHKMTGLRMVYLTATKGLQKQNLDNFGRYGLVDMRGKENYDCLQYPQLDCKSGSSLGCKFCRGKGCTYEVAKSRARNSDAVITNYDYWMAVNDKAEGLERGKKEADEKGGNRVELLVLDEGHEAAGKLAEYMSCRLYESQLKRFGVYPKSEVLSEWSDWAVMAEGVLEDDIRKASVELVGQAGRAKKKDVDLLHDLQKLLSRVSRLASARGDDWIIESETRQWQGKSSKLWKFDVVWPGRGAEQFLFCKVPKVMVMSATLKPKSMSMLGVKKEDYVYNAWPRIFPAARHPMYMVGPRKASGKRVMVDSKTSDADIALLIKWVDREIIKPRLDRKGLIQTVSYKLQSWVMDQSEYSRYMIGNTGEPDSDTAEQKAEEYRRAKPPSILVSPSFTTGWDFPMEQCEYVVLIKVPYLPFGGKLIKARLEQDEFWSKYHTMQTIEQGVGRGMRKYNDQCEVFLIDGHFAYFLSNNKFLAQSWFVPNVRSVVSVPEPPETLWKSLGKGGSDGNQKR